MNDRSRPALEQKRFKRKGDEVARTVGAGTGPLLKVVRQSSTHLPARNTERDLTPGRAGRRDAKRVLLTFPAGPVGQGHHSSISQPRRPLPVTPWPPTNR